MIIYHRGLNYTLTPTIDYDGRTVLDIELDNAAWTVDWIEVMEDIHDLDLHLACWPSTKPLPGFRVDDILAACLCGFYREEIRALIEQQIEDCAVAVQGATEGGE